MARFSIFGYYGQGNAGDEAILAALIDGIKAQIPAAAVSVYSANPSETTKTHHIPAYGVFSLDPKPLIKSLLKKSRIDYIKSLYNFFVSDVVVIGGGGLFFDSLETNKWIYGYLKLIHRAKRFGKKVALVGISVGPLHHRDSELAIGKAFVKADLISVRDKSSKEVLIKCGVTAEKIHVIPDLVFTLKSATNQRVQEILSYEGFHINERPNIALTPCCYNTEHEGWLTQYIAICERIVSELDGNLWLIPMQRNDHHDDLSAIHNIVSRLTESAQKRTRVLKGSYNAKEVQGVLSSADCVLAERLHGSIMALNSNTPFMSIAYMPKVVGVLELAQLQKNIIDYDSFLTGKSQQHIINVFGQYIGTINESASTIAVGSGEAEKNFVQLLKLTQH